MQFKSRAIPSVRPVGTTRKHKIAVAGLLAAMALGQAVAASPQVEAYQKVQQARTEAGKKAGDAASPAQLQQARRELQEQLDYVRSEGIRELSYGSPFLASRERDLLLDQAVISARLGEDEAALAQFEAAYELAVLPSSDRLKHPALDRLRTHPRFAALMQREQQAQAQGEGRAYLTQAMPDAAQRVAGLSRLWAEAKAGFVHFDHVPKLDWDQAYLDALPRVQAATDLESYYLELMRFMARLEDGHSTVVPPAALREKLMSRPPLDTVLLDGKLLVQRVRSSSLAAQLAPGDQIEAIDGRTPADHVAQRLAAITSASTPQDRQNRLYNRFLLAGAADQPVKLSVRKADGRSVQVDVARSGYQDLITPAAFEFRMLPSGIAYLALDHFESDAGLKAFEQALPQILQAKGLILDLRRNGGGNSSHGWSILSYLSDKPIPTATSSVRGDSPWTQARFGSGSQRLLPLESAPYTVKIARQQRFDGPVAVLIGAATYSAAEDFLVGFDSLQRGLIVGEPSGGSTGQPLRLALPGGGFGLVCVKRDRYPDGRSFVGVGIQPQHLAKATQADLRQGRDAVLEQAVQLLTRPR